MVTNDLLLLLLLLLIIYYLFGLFVIFVHTSVKCMCWIYSRILVLCGEGVNAVVHDLFIFVFLLNLFWIYWKLCRKKNLSLKYYCTCKAVL